MHDEGHRRSTTLYDIGGWWIIPMMGGAVVLGVVVDFFWNFLVLSLALRWQRISIARRTRFAYTAVLTAIGLLIDWLYFNLVWGNMVIGSLRIPAIFEQPGLNPGLELSTILAPIALLWGVSYVALRFRLHLDARVASKVGLAFAVFTAPWLIVVFVLLRTA